MRIELYQARPGVFVTMDGRAFQELKFSPSSGGYHTTHLQGATVRRHTLILEAFHGPRQAGEVARHLDGDPTNDHPLNLMWGTQAENCKDTIAHGKSTTGSKNPQSKLSEQKVLQIKADLRDGIQQRVIAKKFEVSEQTICDIKHGRQWKHVGDPS